MADTGENQQALRKIIDFLRMGSIIILALHVYIQCYGAFLQLGWRLNLTDKIIGKVAQVNIFHNPWAAKTCILILLTVSLLGVKGRKDDKITLTQIIRPAAMGLVIFFACIPLLYLPFSIVGRGLLYTVCSITGYGMMLTGGTLASRYLKQKLQDDLFNEENETFPQLEAAVENEYSFHFPARYRYKNKIRKSIVSIANPFRSTLILGTPGSGKSLYGFNPMIRQSVQKGYVVFVFDFKFPDLTKIAYNTWLQSADREKIGFYYINFDDLSRTHRCNPLEPSTMVDITDASESARTIMMGLNRQWIKQQGEFFIESSINFVTAIIWFLRKYEDGRYCTLPHAIELLQCSYDDLFPVLRTQSEIETLINPFVSAYVNNALQQLEGQIASAKIGLARLVSPSLYYVLTGNDFTLGINDPGDPKHFCIGSNPAKQHIYSAVISLYVSRLTKSVNQKGKLKSHLIFDEYPTIFFNGMDTLIATARSNKVATTLGVQDYSQLKKDYGAEQAEVIMNIVGNIISGQVSGDTARQLSERFGKIMQARNSKNINSSDVSFNYSSQLDSAIPASTIAQLSSGEFVGIVADTPQQPIDLKMFHSQFEADFDALAKMEKGYQDMPVINEVSDDEKELVFLNVRLDVLKIIEAVLDDIKHDPGKAHLLIRK